MLTNLASYSVFIVVTFLVLSWFTKSYAESSLRLRILVILIGIFLLLMVISVESPTDRSSMAFANRAKYCHAFNITASAEILNIMGCASHKSRYNVPSFLVSDIDNTAKRYRIAFGFIRG